MKLHILQNTRGESIVCSEQSMWYNEVKNSLWGQLDEKGNGQKLI